jgi:hypothetical protein
MYRQFDDKNVKHFEGIDKKQKSAYNYNKGVKIREMISFCFVLHQCNVDKSAFRKYNGRHEAKILKHPDPGKP